MLRLSLAGASGGVELTTDQALAGDLQRLRVRLTSAVTLSHSSIVVPIEELLLNLDALAKWPDDAFEWDPQLLRLVENNFADSQVVEAELHEPTTGVDEPIAIPGGGWLAPMTTLQRSSVGKLLKLRHGANFSVPGAGKTRCTLALFQYRRLAGEASRLLVVCPKSAFDAWRDEVGTCLPGELSVAVVSSTELPDADVLLVNYERLPDLVSRLIRWLAEVPTMLVLDEAHRMKLGARGAWGAASYALGPYAAHRVILSGTPAPNGVQDLENLLGFVWPGQGRNAVSQAVSNRTLAEASQRLKPLFTRITKDQLDIPPYHLGIRRVQLPPLHREIYNALLGASTLSPQTGTQNLEALGRVVMYLLMAATSPALLAVGSSRYEPLRYRVPPLVPPPGSHLDQLMRDLPSYEMSPKFTEAAAIVRRNAERKRKTLVWSTFVRGLTSLERMLAAYEPAVVHGGTEDRAAQLARFRRSQNCWVLLSNPATLGEGVSLHHDCHEAVYVDRDFAAGKYLQSLDRIHRLGLTPDTETNVTVLVADGTIDEVVNQRLDTKVDFLLRILDDPAVQVLTDLDEEPTLSGNFTEADVRALMLYLQGDGAK